MKSARRPLTLTEAGSALLPMKAEPHPTSLSAQPGFAHERHSRNRKRIEGFSYSGFLGWSWALLIHPPPYITQLPFSSASCLAFLSPELLQEQEDGEQAVRISPPQSQEEQPVMHSSE